MGRGGKGKKKGGHNKHKKEEKERKDEEKRKAKAEDRKVKEELHKAKEAKKKREMDEYFDGFGKQLRPLGLGVKDIEGDGNCLFRAVADQMGNVQNHRSVRNTAVEFMRDHEEDFGGFMIDTTLDAYCNHMGTSGVWGGNLEIVAVSKAYRVNVVIHQFEQPRWTVNYDGEPEHQDLHLSYHDGMHYSSVRNLTDISSHDLPTPIDIELAEARLKEARARAEASGGASRNKQVVLTEDEKTIVEATGCKKLSHIRMVLWEYYWGNVQDTIEYLKAEQEFGGDDGFMATGEEITADVVTIDSGAGSSSSSNGNGGDESSREDGGTSTTTTTSTSTSTSTGDAGGDDEMAAILEAIAKQEAGEDAGGYFDDYGNWHEKKKTKKQLREEEREARHLEMEKEKEKNLAHQHNNHKQDEVDTEDQSSSRGKDDEPDLSKMTNKQRRKYLRRKKEQEKEQKKNDKERHKRKKKKDEEMLLSDDEEDEILKKSMGSIAV